MDRPILEIHNQSGPGIAIPWLRVYLEQILVLLKQRQGCWSVTLVDDPTMVDLHQRAMNRNTTTDVLTFDLRDAGQRDDKITTLDLDTVICVDEAARQAGTRGHTLREEILLYAIHSLLHVLGHDDATPAQARRMHQREDEILTKLGIGPVYAPAELKKATAAKNGRKKRKASKMKLGRAQGPKRLRQKRKT